MKKTTHKKMRRRHVNGKPASTLELVLNPFLLREAKRVSSTLGLTLQAFCTDCVESDLARRRSERMVSYV